jgi:pyridoxal 5'-phosphate synthase pdxS subunit
MDFAIQDKDGNLSLPNGQTVPSTQNGSTTPTTTTKPTASSTTSSSIPLPTRTDPTQKSHTGTFGVKSGLAQMLKGGVIMDVMNVEQAKVAEEAGAVSVMALERIPSLIRSQGGIARMVSPEVWVGADRATY